MAINIMPDKLKKEPKKGFKQWLKELFCGHDESAELRVDKTGTKKRHYHYCKKCSKRWYID